MKKILNKYKIFATDKRALYSLVFSFVLLAVSLVINSYAGSYAAREASNSVNDILLSNIPPFDVGWIFIFGPFVLWALVAVLLAKDPKKIAFTIKSIALFVVIRSVFTSLTHIGPFPTQVVLDSDFIKKFTSGSDLFFSGHTGLPFLMALVFWKDKKLRIIFFLSAVLFGIVVLLAHLHYSIDVLSAFFITYSIYKIAEIWFKKDKELFDSNDN